MVMITSLPVLLGAPALPTLAPAEPAAAVEAPPLGAAPAADVEPPAPFAVPALLLGVPACEPVTALVPALLLEGAPPSLFAPALELTAPALPPFASVCDAQPTSNAIPREQRLEMAFWFIVPRPSSAF
jgi:hypothetical protein